LPDGATFGFSGTDGRQSLQVPFQLVRIGSAAQRAEFFGVQLMQGIQVLETGTIQNYPNIDKFFALDPGHDADDGVFK
jgi:hypothetical protein